MSKKCYHDREKELEKIKSGYKRNLDLVKNLSKRKKAKKAPSTLDKRPRRNLDLDL